MNKKDKIVIRAGTLTAEAHLSDTETARAIGSILPITGTVALWGDEIYFSIPLELGLAADARDLVEAGDIGYWPDGKSFCIFFGKTPISRGNEIRAASKVNVFGRVLGDPASFKTVVDGQAITVSVLDT